MKIFVSLESAQTSSHVLPRPHVAWLVRKHGNPYIQHGKAVIVNVRQNTSALFGKTIDTPSVT